MRDKVILVCTECLSRNYVTTVKREGQNKRYEVKKFCPKCNKHTLHRETK